jgi:Mn2+/Fe2+ NRAMP family transporter
MPHNLYLHSSIVQTRNFTRNDSGKASAIRYAAMDSSLALLFAFFINASILVLSAAAFHGTEHQDLADISDAYKLLTPVLGSALASTVFAIALLACGQNSTVTGTLAGQIVMEVSSISASSMVEATVDAASGGGSGGRSCRGFRRSGCRQASHTEPGRSFTSAQLRRLSAGGVYR